MSTAEVTRHLVGASEDVPEGGRLVVDVGGTTVGVFRVGGALFAYENVCAHQGGPVCQGRIVPRVAEVVEPHSDRNDLYFDDSDPHIVCPWHGYEYSIVTGEHAGVSSVRLRSFATQEEGGMVYVVL